ncbi:MAG: DUF2322 family protein [Neisseria sp.]
MNFQNNLAMLPAIDYLSGLNVFDANGNIVHYIAAVTGKLGSLKIYAALALQFDHILNQATAEQGLIWFAEHVADAQAQSGQHPNIDFLLRVKNEQLVYTLAAVFI